MKEYNWNPIEYHNTKYWSMQLPTPEHMTKIAVAQERIDDKSFPYLLIFNELINADHWWGGKQRFGHGHQIKFEMFYFDPEGNGDFVTGEELRWMPHYLAALIPSKKESLSLDDQLRESFSRHPRKDLFSSVLEPKQNHSLSEADVIKKIGAPFEVLFEYYQDPNILAEERESILSEKRANHERFGGIFSLGNQDKQEPYEPKFDLQSSLAFDKQQYLLRILKKASGFDIYAAPKQVGRDDFEGAFMGMVGVSPFPGPVDFLEGMNKEDGEGQLGNTGLNFFTQNPCGEKTISKNKKKK